MMPMMPPPPPVISKEEIKTTLQETLEDVSVWFFFFFFEKLEVDKVNDDSDKQHSNRQAPVFDEMVNLLRTQDQGKMRFIHDR